MEAPVLVERELSFARGGQRARGVVAIYAPTVVDPAESCCEVEVRAPGVLQFRSAIRGADTLQALLLAIRFLAARLTDFQAKGGHIADVDGGEFPFEAYFGELNAAPRPTTPA